MMSAQVPRPPTSVWATMKALWVAARRRGVAQQQRQRDIMRLQRKKDASRGIGLALSVLGVAIIHGLLAGEMLRLVSGGNAPGLASLPSQPSQGAVFAAGLVLLWWVAMLVLQGEGLELDTQRRRHPMWEWLLSHPVRPAAALCAEVLSPALANPVYLTAPVFWLVVFWRSYGFAAALGGAVLVGLPYAGAAACLNKSVEVAALLRLSPRARGAALGMMNWAGYVAMVLPFFFLRGFDAASGSLVRFGAEVAWLPVAPLRWLIVGWAEQPSLWQTVVAGWAFAALLLATAVLVGGWGMAHGLVGSGSDVAPARVAPHSVWLPRNALYRKELLWFWRDRSAVVQVVLIPLTVGAIQATSMRGLLGATTWQATSLCGVGILFGTYFLLVLGPRSLQSEGAALWIALTWPRGLEDLLAAKARLWWLLSNVVVGIVFLAAAVVFPADWWLVALIAVGWLVFSAGLARKAVTLVTAPSSSGQPERPPRGRQWAALLGTFSFAAGVFTANWYLAIVGVVFSSLTGAAMWQNLRVRLPHLFDPWTEKLPPAPTLMHAMIGIMAMTDAIGAAMVIGVAWRGKDSLWAVLAVSYGVVGVLAWSIMQSFLSERGVRARDIWCWRRPGREDDPWNAADAAWRWPLWRSLIPAALLGAALAGVVVISIGLLRSLPQVDEYLRQVSDGMALGKDRLLWQLLLAVGFAPFAEEFFFRGLLFRALDREWGGIRAVAGSAAFFAAYHQPVAWLPVVIVGLLNAAIFKRTGRLAPCVGLHMAYNAVVVWFA